MNVYLYSGFQKLIEKSGVGRAIYHQKTAAEQAGIGVAHKILDADVIHINTIFPQSVLLAYFAHLNSIPVVYHAHSTKEDFRNSFIGSNAFDPLFGKWIKYCYNLGDIIVTPTNYSKKLLESYGIKKDIEAISNGIDLNYYNKENVDPAEFRKEYGYKSTDKIIMSVGLTIERKGILDFVELARRMPEYQFIWFGDINLNTVPLKIRTAVNTKLPNLRFAGYVKKDSLRKAYAGCDLFLFPTFEETEGIVVLEALAMKIPVLLRDIPVYEDWLEKDKHVYKSKSVEEFSESITGILENKKDSLVENGYSKVKDYSITRIGEKLLYVYKKSQKKYLNRPTYMYSDNFADSIKKKLSIF